MEGLSELEVMGVEQDHIPNVGQLQLTNVPVEGWLTEHDVHGLPDMYNIFHRPDEAILFVMVKVCPRLKNILLVRTFKEFIVIIIRMILFVLFPKCTTMALDKLKVYILNNILISIYLISMI